MTFIGPEAQFLSNHALAKWLIEDFPFRIQLAPVFPFYAVAGHELRYSTTPALTPGATIEDCAPIPEDTKLPGDPPQRIGKFSEIATQFRIAYNAEDEFSSNVNDQVAVQTPLAIRELLYKFWTLFESGNSVNPGEFDGLDAIVNPSQVIDLACGELTLETLDAALDKIRSNDGRCRVIYTSGIGKRAILAAHYVRGLEPEYEEVEVPCATGGTKKEQVLKYDGALVYVNDLNQVFECVVPAAARKGKARRARMNLVKPPELMSMLESGELLVSDLATNIWFFVMGQNNLHGITPASVYPNMFVPRSTILPDESCLVYHMTMPTGIALGSASALAVIKNAKIPVQPPPPSDCICVIDHDYDTLLISNTAVETDVYNVTIPGDLDINDIYQMHVIGRARVQPATTVTFRLYLGGSSISFTENFPSNANELTFRIECRMIKNEATNSQKLSFFGEFKRNTSTGPTEIVAQIGTAAEDTTLNQSLRLTVQFAAAGVNRFLRAEARYLERLRV
jgi:hypothetical protein